jgi:myosin heavy subunit
MKYKIYSSTKIEDFEYLNKSKCYEVPRLDDVTLYNEVEDSFQVLGFKDYIDSIFSCISSILKLGNVKFDESTLTNDTPCSISTRDLFFEVCSLLKIDSNGLTNGITNKLRVINK